ncbi:hypothetical protein JCM8097_007979 [Rhodosporidiobolus ruineniae]
MDTTLPAHTDITARQTPPSPAVDTASSGREGGLDDAVNDGISEGTRVLAGVDALKPLAVSASRSGDTFEDEKRRSGEEGREGAVAEEDDGREPVTGIRLWLLMLALLLVEVLVGLDNTIVATATGEISNHFHALTDVGWYGSAYLLTCVAFQPLFGRALQFFPQKWVFLIALVIFLFGSLIAAVAISSAMLIAGRALQGLGYAGLFIGILAITANTLPIRMQAVVTSLMNMSYGTGTVFGPLIGGAFTTKVSWRWCFWINLPIGGLAVVLIILFCNPPRIKQTLPVRERLHQMDFLGAFLLLGSLICLLLALQMGGITAAWSSSKVIGLLVGFVVILAAFFALQTYLGEKSSISMRLLTRDRSLAAVTLVNFTCGASYFAILYWLPLFYQTVQGVSPVRAGVQLLPLIFFNMSGGIVAGWVVKHFGVFHPGMLLGTGLTAIGAGLAATMDAQTTQAQWIGYGIVVGAGMGTLYMLSFIASQMLLPEEDRSKGASLVCFSQIFGATVWVSASSALYANKFKEGIQTVEGLDVQQVLDSGVDRFREVVAPEQLDAVIDVAVKALWNVFLAVAVIAAVGFVTVFAIRWVSLGRHADEKKGEKEAKKRRVDEESS